MAQSILTDERVMSLIGIPFEYGARGPDKYDCWGLLMELYHEIHGVQIPDYESPVVIQHIAFLMSRDRHLWRAIKSKPGAAVLFKIDGVGAHVGIQIEPDWMLHTIEEQGGIKRDRLSIWENFHKIIGYYEYVG